MLRYLLLLIVFSVAAGALFLAMVQFFPGTFLPEQGNYLLIYFFLLTAVFHFGLVRSSQGKPALFVRYYMAATSAKLMIHLAVIVLYAITHKETAFRFILTFLPFYVLFTAFEVGMAFRQNRQKSDSDL